MGTRPVSSGHGDQHPRDAAGGVCGVGPDRRQTPAGRRARRVPADTLSRDQISVAVDVPGPGHADAQQPTRLVRLELGRRGRGIPIRDA